MNSPRKRKVCLTVEQRQRLEAITRNGTAPAKKIRHARVLLLSDSHHPNGRYPDAQIASILGMHHNTVARIRTRFVLFGEGPALERKVRATPPTPPKLDGQAEATLVAICCSPPPEGRTRWTLQLLRQEMMGRQIVTRISRETIRKTLKKTSYSRGASSGSASRNGMRPASSPRWNKCSTRTPSR